MLKDKHILLGITGSIAAYKAAVLCRLLKTAGADVRVVMTPLAKQFITPLTMATLSKNPILVDFFDPENGAWNSHVALGEWADCYLIAPATANTLAKMAHGVADNLLLTTYLSSRAPVVVAPAMDLDMYAHAATQTNLDTLRRTGVQVVSVTDADGHGVEISGDNLEVSVQPWLPEELEAAYHPSDLMGSVRTVLDVAMFRKGIGGDDSWGAYTHQEYLLNADGKMEFSFSFKGI